LWSLWRIRADGVLTNATGKLIRLSERLHDPEAVLDRNSITQHIETEAVHSVSDILRESANRCANAAAILAPGRPPFTYGALFEQARSIGAQLRSRGIAAEDRVALALPNGP